MKFAIPASALFAMLLVGCSDDWPAAPTVPDFTSASLGVGTTVSREISDPRTLTELKDFLRQTHFQWRPNGRMSTPTAGDVAIVLYVDAKWTELVQFSERLLLIGDHVTDLSPEEVDRLLEITGLSRQEAFASDGKRPEANKSVESNAGYARRDRHAWQQSNACRGVPHA